MTPELLAPAGGPEALRAAVQCGAGAVYLGWGDFNARRSAKNFSDEEFVQALRYCHERGVRVFLTLNTLVTDRELPAALETARQASRLGVDAVLVQDWGLLSLLRAVLPDLPLHASTQMSLFTSGGANEAAALGCERIVLARECSKEDVAAIRARCPAELEYFVHGALCMCYSGQCAMSALIGGRSGNRGRCAQPCRLPYGFDRRAAGGHPLSLKDSCLAGELEPLSELGVDCLKLEGRMKRPEYVAVVTGVYARLLAQHRRPTAEELSALELAFSRQGFTDGYWQGRRGPALFGSRPEDAPEPKELFAQARSQYERDDRRLVPVDVSCALRAGVPISLTVSDRDGHTVTVAGPVPEPARTRPLTADELESRLRKTGGTAYRCGTVSVQADEGLSLPASAVNALRRDALTALAGVRTAPPSRRELPVPPMPSALAVSAAPALTVSVARWEQLSPALLAGQPARVCVPLELLAKADALPPCGGQWCAILPRVWRDRDEALLGRWLDHAQALGVTGVLLGNLGHLPLTRGRGLHLYGDHGLNVFNSRAAALLAQQGLESAAVSFELRFSQIRDLKSPIPTEAIVYGRLPLMVTEHCLVQNETGCALDRKGCAVPEDAPCRAGHFLCDRTGAKFPLLPAFGHRTELQNAKPLYLADRTDWKHLGLTYARLRFTTESAEDCAALLRAYQTGAPAEGDFTRGLYDRGVE